MALGTLRLANTSCPTASAGRCGDHKNKEAP